MNTPDLLDEANFYNKDSIFYQRDLKIQRTFEDSYLQLREKENRIYSDDLLRNLPDIDDAHPNKREWAIRKSSLKKLIHYLRKKTHFKYILELGCGNGWLSHQLAISLKADIYGLDINQTELEDAARVFGHIPNVHFVFGDIFTLPIKAGSFDVIILGGSVQYFSDFHLLITKLLELLSPSGEIHIIDSPFYKTREIEGAKERSSQHFREFRVPLMSDHYHYHDWQSLQHYKHEVMHNPYTLWNKLKRRVVSDSPFPWIIIRPQGLPVSEA